MQLIQNNNVPNDQNSLHKQLPFIHVYFFLYIFTKNKTMMNTTKFLEMHIIFISSMVQTGLQIYKLFSYKRKIDLSSSHLYSHFSEQSSQLGFLKNLTNFAEKHRQVSKYVDIGVSSYLYFNNIVGRPATFKKETPTKVFSCEI